MECAQSVGIDLPLNALLWEGTFSQVWLGYSDPEYPKQRQGAAHYPAAGSLRQALSGPSR
jgi:uncharacterized protein (DUF302 family)